MHTNLLTWTPYSRPRDNITHPESFHLNYKLIIHHENKKSKIANEYKSHNINSSEYLYFMKADVIYLKFNEYQVYLF